MSLIYRLFVQFKLGFSSQQALLSYLLPPRCSTASDLVPAAGWKKNLLSNWLRSISFRCI
jgi:hypothetical protein